MSSAEARISAPASVDGARRPPGLVARVLARIRLRACDRVGRDVVLDGAPVVRNLGRIQLGDSLALSSHPAPSHLVTGPGGELRIGDRVTIAHGASVAAHALVDIGDDVVVGPFAMIMDTDFHDVRDRSRPSEATPIVIGASAHIGASVTILRGSTIGAGARVLAGSVVSGQVPPGALVAGVPARRVGGAAHTPDAAADAGSVAAIVQRTLGLGTPPAPTSGPHDLAEWDSLGALNIMLSLEDSFGVVLDPTDMMRVRCVADLVDVVTRARQARG